MLKIYFKRYSHQEPLRVIAVDSQLTVCRIHSFLNRTFDSVILLLTITQALFIFDSQETSIYKF